MCVVDRLILVYPPDIRKPKDKLTPCRYSVDGQACSRAYIREIGEHYVLPRSRSEGRYHRPSTYQIIEPTKPAQEAKHTKPRSGMRGKSINLDLFGIRIPWSKWSVKKETGRTGNVRPKGRERPKREANPFIVEPPEPRTYRPRPQSRPRSRPPVQEIRPRSPISRPRPSTPPPQQPPNPSEPSPSTPSPRRYPRAPRERTPVSDRVPLRPRPTPSPPKPPVIIHHRRGDDSPPITPTREHRRQRGTGASPQTDPIRHVNRSKDLRRQAEEDARRQPERGRDFGHRTRMEDDTRKADWAERDRRYARLYQDERPLRSFAEREYDRHERGRDRYGPPLVIQGGGGHRIQRESERIYSSEVRNSNRNRYGFPSSMFDRFRPQQEYRDYGPGGYLPRRSSMPYGQKIVLDDDTQRSGWRWR
ncbi:hypothetical protein FQN54_000919 [Arachnomyces sp. PD_36]|nr:hypothetical protein FQN54_000919 [Arachnomyces sp. PD_36]